MDNDDYRRGKLTTHKFGEDFGILAGDGLLNLAYETMLSAIHKATKIGDAQAVLRYSATADVIANKAGVDGMVGGQSLDVMLTDKPMNEEQLDYIQIKDGCSYRSSIYGWWNYCRL
ncbi:MAG: polyprenyl synthetase family protein [Lachnospira pectinoschiza]